MRLCFVSKDFSVDYDSTDVDDNLYIFKYLIKNHAMN